MWQPSSFHNINETKRRRSQRRRRKKVFYKTSHPVVVGVSLRQSLARFSFFVRFQSGRCWKLIIVFRATVVERCIRELLLDVHSFGGESRKCHKFTCVGVCPIKISRLFGKFLTFLTIEANSKFMVGILHQPTSSTDCEKRQNELEVKLSDVRFAESSLRYGEK